MESVKQDSSNVDFNDYSNLSSKSVIKSISQKWNVMKVMVGLLQQSKYLIKHSFKHKKIYFSVIVFLMYLARKKFKGNSSKKEVVENIFENERVQLKDQTNDYIKVLEQFQKGIKIPKPTDLFNQFFNKKQENKTVNDRSPEKKEKSLEQISEPKKEESKTSKDESKTSKDESKTSKDESKTSKDVGKVIKKDVNNNTNCSKPEYSLQENERYVLEKNIKTWEEPPNANKEYIFQQYFMYEKNKYYRFNMNCLFSDVTDVIIILYKMKTGDYESAVFETFSMNGNGVQSNKKDEELYPFTFCSDYMYFNESGKMMIEFIFSPAKKDISLDIKNIDLKIVEHPIIGTPKAGYYFMTSHNEKKKFAFPVYLRSANIFLEEKNTSVATIKDLF